MHNYPAELAEWSASAGLLSHAPSRVVLPGLPPRDDYLPMDVGHIAAAGVAAVPPVDSALGQHPHADLPMGSVLTSSWAHMPDLGLKLAGAAAGSATAGLH